MVSLMLNLQIALVFTLLTLNRYLLRVGFKILANIYDGTFSENG